MRITRLKRREQSGHWRRDVAQSVTLLRLFLLASAAILLVGGTALGWVLNRTLQNEALDAARSKLSLYVDGVARPTLVKNGHVVVTRRGDTTIRNALRLERDIVSVKVWRADGTLAWTNRQQSRIGRRFPVAGDLAETLHGNTASAGLVSTDAHGENAFERSLGFTRLFEIYTPIRSADGSSAIGAYEIYADPAAVEQLIGSRRTLIWGAVAAVFLVLWGAFALLVRRASQTLRRQNEELRVRSARLLESNRLLEAGALEAVESLNATVDAKDPYTAGHSQRVQQIALALGAQLGLTDDRLDALRFAGLFHDIGKLGVPDAILLKPGRLTAAEYEQIKRHPEDGARIVGRLRRLEHAVPLIRHHHERWDGGGYPDGLAGDAIPLEAAIVGLADALDAMTTDRPYSAGRPLADAAAEIARCRGTQFAPAVVDAFFSVLARSPEIFRSDDTRCEAVAV